ncbi:MAG TPA: response regulator transcription factor [Candidatus Didemnitutus sp.]|nr:response regulator transcription factor [Candidatus Didemnitutus sp.]
MTAGAPPLVKVVMIDDSSIIRLGLRAALEDRVDITIIGEAANGRDGLALIEKLQPDVALLDLRLPDQSGLDVCREIGRRRPATKVLILTSSTDERTVHDAVAAGAQGYLLKESDSASLAQAIRQVASGHSVLDPTLTDHVVRLMKNRPEPRPAEKLALLSGQERKVLALLSEGLTNKEIGERLNLTEKTVKNYLATVFDKLGVARRAQAAALFTQAQHS